MDSDRSGKPTLRVWVLPRISHPGLAVWDDARGGKGRYQVMQQMGRGRGRDTYAPTGVQFHDLASLQKYLNETSQLAE